MFEKLLKYEIPINIKSIYGLNIELLSDGSRRYSVVGIRKRKNEVEIVQNKDNVDWETVTNSINNNSKLVVNISGKGILHKRLAIDSEISHKDLLHLLMPNAKNDDFYLQKVMNEKTDSWVSIARKDLIDKILNELKSAGFYTIDLSLGPFTINPLLKILNEDLPSNITIFNQVLQFENSTIVDIQNVDVKLKRLHEFDNHQLHDGEYLALGSIFRELIPDNTFHSINFNDKVLNQIEFKQKLINKVLSYSIVAFAFLLLMANFIFFSHYRNEHTELSNSMEKKDNIVSKLRQLNSEKENLESFIDQLGLNTKVHLSLLADELVYQMPHGIQLNEFKINPLTEEDKGKEEMIFEYNTISIKGETRKSTQLNDWMKAMNILKWVENVELLEFNKMKNQENHQFHLKIELIS